MTDESTTEDFAATVAATGGQHRRTERERQHSLASVRYRMSPRGDSVSLSGRHLVHGHPDKHLQPDENSNLWTALLSSSLGYLLPNPTLRRHDE